MLRVYMKVSAFGMRGAISAAPYHKGTCGYVDYAFMRFIGELIPRSGWSRLGGMCTYIVDSI